MDEGNSKKVGLVEITDEDSMPSTSSSETRPLIVLFDRIIFNYTNSTTLLTKVQILLILEKEFDMDIKTLHALEREIYINIIKTYLKDWPQWDTFDRIINELKKEKAVPNLKSILEQNYKDLKEYLGDMIKTVKPATDGLVNKLKILTMEPTDSLTLENNDDAVLKVISTKRHLNSFICYGMNAAENNSVFNLIDFEPCELTSAAPPSYTFSSILHWYNVRLCIDLPFFQLSRDTAHTQTHTLVNDSNGIQRNLQEECISGIYMRTICITTDSFMVDLVIILLNKILKQYSNKPEYDMLKQIFNVIKYDLRIDNKTVEAPGSYKHHLSNYPYVRKLFTNDDLDVPSSHNMYIEEMVTPIQDWHIGKFIHVNQPMLPDLESWLKFECVECNQKFMGVDLLTNLQEHFKMFHLDEPDWTCTNCEKVFSMAELTDQGWWHDC